MIHETTVRVMTRQNQFKLEWRAPNPTVLRLDGTGLTFFRGSDPQEDSVLKGRPQLTIPWSDVLNIRFNKLWNSAIRVDLRPGRTEFRTIWIQWLTQSATKPYEIMETAVLHKLVRQFWETAAGPALERYDVNSQGSV
jgi:hypothetical protein